MLLLIIAAAVPAAFSAESSCVTGSCAIVDDTSLLQVESNLKVGTHSTKGHIGTASLPVLAAHLDEKKAESHTQYLWLDERVPYRTSSYEASFVSNNYIPYNGTGIDSGLILLDSCPQNEVFVTMIAATVSLSVLVASSIVILMVFEFGGEHDMRQKFHATRIVPWIYLAIIGCVSIPLTLNRMWTEDVRFSEIVTSCVPTVPCFVVVQFGLLLVYDLFFITFVFRTILQKPLLLCHHLGYLTWCLLTLYGQVGYLNLVAIVIGMEEFPELAASISYLKKGTKHAHWWLVFTIAFRMCCSTYAIGCTLLFIMLGYAKWELKGFLWFDICLWSAFAWQEWRALQDLVPDPRKLKGEVDNKAESIGSGSDAAAKSAPEDSAHN